MRFPSYDDTFKLESPNTSSTKRSEFPFDLWFAEEAILHSLFVRLPVEVITFSPLFLSLSPGQTAQLTGITKNYAGSTIVADVNYASSNTNLVTITATGLVCAGLWDANFITCNALRGQSAVGQATITATSGTATATAAVYTHLNVDRIFVNPTSGCVSVGATPP